MHRFHLYIISIIAILSVANISYARDPRRGYRGFVEWDNTIGRTDVIEYRNDGPCVDVRDADWLTGFATTHGYQINNHCFTGLGFMLSLSGNPTLMLPGYIDFRYDARFGKFTPYADAKLGMELTHQSIYFSPTVGYRFNCGGKVNFNLGLGMTVWGRESEYTGQSSDRDYLESNSSYNITKFADVLLTLRLGIDF